MYLNFCARLSQVKRKLATQHPESVSIRNGGRLPPVNTMIRLAPLFDKTFFETCLREKMDSAKIRDRDVEIGQKYLLKNDSTQNTTEEERLRKLKRKLKREMHLEKSWGI